MAPRVRRDPTHGGQVDANAWLSGGTTHKATFSTLATIGAVNTAANQTTQRTALSSAIATTNSATRTVGATAKSFSTLLVFAGAIAITLLLMMLSRAFGSTFDERVRHSYGEQVLSFFHGQLSYSDFAQDDTSSYLYGGLFDTTAAAVHHVLDGNVWLERHYVGAAFAGVGFLATGLLAVRLAGAPVGLLSMVLLALSPRFVGHATNNPKDMPFAALCVVSVLAFTAVRSIADLKSWKRAALIGFALALPLNVRPAGVLLIGYFGGWVAAVVLRDATRRPRDVWLVLVRFTVVSAVALTLGTTFWPWAQQQPLVRPIRALLETSHFKWHGNVLFEGNEVAADGLPWMYAPVWIGITTPPVVLFGLLVAAVSTFIARKDDQLWRYGLWTVALTPIVLVIARHSTLYDGWRHLLFVYPPLVVLAASGWRDLLSATWKRPLGSAVALAALILGCGEPLLFMVRNHPNEVVYFNGFVGGPRGAFKRFELDYWGNSLLQAAQWSADAAQCSGVPLAVSGWPFELVEEDASRFPSVYVTTPGAEAHHLQLQLLRDSRDALRRTIGRHDILYTVRTDDGAPLAVVLRGPKFEEVARFATADVHTSKTDAANGKCVAVRAAFQRVMQTDNGF